MSQSTSTCQDNKHVFIFLYIYNRCITGPETWNITRGMILPNTNNHTEWGTHNSLMKNTNRPTILITIIQTLVWYIPLQKRTVTGFS